MEPECRAPWVLAKSDVSFFTASTTEKQLPRSAQAGSDRAELGAYLATEERDPNNADDRNERHEKSVLDEGCSVLVSNKILYCRLETSHLCSPKKLTRITWFPQRCPNEVSDNICEVWWVKRICSQ